MPETRTLWWPSAHRGGRLEKLEPAESVELMGSTSIGRLAYVTADGPRIVPVNFVVTGDRLVFRTAPGTELERLAVGTRVAFEVDQTDEFLQTGWSVIAVGTLTEAASTTVRELGPDGRLDPWAEGMRSIFLQLPLDSVTGRRVHPA